MLKNIVKLGKGIIKKKLKSRINKKRSRKIMIQKATPKIKKYRLKNEADNKLSATNDNTAQTESKAFVDQVKNISCLYYITGTSSD